MGIPHIFTRLVIWALFGRWRICTGILGLGLLAAALGVAAPYLQKLFVDQLWELHGKGGSVSRILDFAGYLSYIFGAFLCMIAAQSCTWIIRILAAKESIRIQSELSEKIYDHVINLHPEARGRFSVGEMVTFYVQDVGAAGSLSEECFPNLVASLIPLVVAPISVGLILGSDIGHVFAVALVGTVVCFGLSWRQSKLFVDYKALSQSRLSVVNEWLQNLKLLRVSGRIPEFEGKIFERRHEETRGRMAMVSNASIMNSFAQLLPQLINIAGLGVLIIQRGNQGIPLSAGEIFGVLWVLGVFLGSPLRQLPWALVTAVDGISSLKRVYDFLELPELSQSSVKSKSRNISRSPVSDSSVEIQNLRVSNGDGRELLTIERLSINAGEFVAIVGPVGAGKSVLFDSLTGAFPALFGSYRIGSQSLEDSPPWEKQRHFTSVPQYGFLMNADLRRNIGLDYGSMLPNDEEMYAGLELAAFCPEAERLSQGLDTPLGERGVNLSGGQKQRLSIARALQFSRPIVLMDDSLSAVDVVTEAHLVENLILKHWSNRTRLLITHRLSVLPRASRVLFLENGRVSGFAPYRELLSKSASFRRFVESLADDVELNADPLRERPDLSPNKSWATGEVTA